MRVQFVRTGERRYGVVVEVPGHGVRRKDPAPGYDPQIPHDLVHYLVEAELGLDHGLYGRLAAGGGDFVDADDGGDPRERARIRRRQLRKEHSLREHDHRRRNDMERSERLAAIADVRWRRRHGGRPDVAHAAPAEPDPADAAALERVLDRLDEVARRWSALPVGGSIDFVWPSPVAHLTSTWLREQAPPRQG